MPAPPLALRTELVVPEVDPLAAFKLLVAELEVALPRSGLRFEPGAAGRLLELTAGTDAREFARIVSWEPGKMIAFEWNATSWSDSSPPLRVTYRFDQVEGGTRISTEYEDWGSTREVASPEAAIGWFASEILRPLIRATSPPGLGDWWTDRVARRPGGEESRRTYADPVYHRPNFLVIFERLRLEREDRLLEVGCGGGAFLQMALKTGCRAWAIDHSTEMVRLAREQNSAAIAEGRLEIHEADAQHLPFADDLCTCAVTTGVFGFIDRPVEVLSEIRRVLRPGGRLVLFTGTKVLRGTPAAPEPVASRAHVYEDEELADLAKQARFVDVKVDRPDFGHYARLAGLPEDTVAFFDSLPGGGQVLQASRGTA
jgi:SAM-dependent methyltransferase